MCFKEHTQRTDYRRPANPSVVPSQDDHGEWGGVVRPASSAKVAELEQEFTEPVVVDWNFRRAARLIWIKRLRTRVTRSSVMRVVEVEEWNSV